MQIYLILTYNGVRVIDNGETRGRWSRWFYLRNKEPETSMLPGNIGPGDPPMRRGARLRPLKCQLTVATESPQDGQADRSE